MKGNTLTPTCPWRLLGGVLAAVPLSVLQACGPSPQPRPVVPQPTVVAIPPPEPQSPSPPPARTTATVGACDVSSVGASSSDFETIVGWLADADSVGRDYFQLENLRTTAGVVRRVAVLGRPGASLLKWKTQSKTFGFLGGQSYSIAVAAPSRLSSAHRISLQRSVLRRHIGIYLNAMKRSRPRGRRLADEPRWWERGFQGLLTLRATRGRDVGDGIRSAIADICDQPALLDDGIAFHDETKHGATVILMLEESPGREALLRTMRSERRGFWDAAYDELSATEAGIASRWKSWVLARCKQP
jgi:hypothetical protein